MVKTIREIGLRRTLKFIFLTFSLAVFDLLLFPPLRTLALRLLGAHIGRNTVIHRVHFFNFDRNGFPGLRISGNCFLGDDCLIDLADAVILEDHVTFAQRVTILTHTNVGYRDHPLQEYIPSMVSPVIFRRGAFVGTNATVLPGVEIGECAVIGAGAVVLEDVPAFSVVGGVPARLLKSLKDS